jgi:hypothetical protein
MPPGEQVRTVDRLSFASHAIASARVFSFRPSGNSIGSSKRRDQDTKQLRKNKNGPGEGGARAVIGGLNAGRGARHPITNPMPYQWFRPDRELSVIAPLFCMTML